VAQGMLALSMFCRRIAPLGCKWLITLISNKSVLICGKVIAEGPWVDCCVRAPSLLLSSGPNVVKVQASCVLYQCLRHQLEHPERGVRE
jgi:hypothetical protein